MDCRTIILVKNWKFVFLGIITVAGWYFTELQPKLRGEGKYMKVKTGVKPEDFVK